jgi:ribonuclease P protein component
VENKQKSKALSRLTKKLEFQSLSKNGTRVYGGQYILANFQHNELGHLRCGWTIPKYVGNAVVRNRIRRWCREFFRSNLNAGWNPPIDMNVIIRKRDREFYKALGFEEFSKSLLSLKNKVEKRLNE